MIAGLFLILFPLLQATFAQLFPRIPSSTPNIFIPQSNQTLPNHIPSSEFYNHVQVIQNSTLIRDLYTHALYAQASYKPVKVIANWSCVFCNHSHVDNTTDIKVINDDVLAYIGYDHHKKWIIVTFRGSSTLYNFYTDAKFHRRKMELTGEEFGTVHSGFYENYLTIRDRVLKEIDKRWRDTGYEVHLTGKFAFWSGL